jgi:hypothetical protein
MKKLAICFLLLVPWVGIARSRQADHSQEAGQLFGNIEKIVAELGNISGLKPLRSIQYDLIDKEHIHQFLLDRIREEVKPEEVRAEELALKKFGFVPADFNLKNTIVELLTEQAAAFYDYRRKKLFVLESAPAEMQQLALVHELAHALADQHFNLERFVEQGNKSDDGSTARLAVMEGQATWLMSEYMARRAGQSLEDSPALIQWLDQSMKMSMTGGHFPVFDSAPLYIKDTLVFPYSQGMLFQNAVIEKLGKQGFSEVFRRPPVSSQQILHPDKYFAGVKPVRPPLPTFDTERDYRELINGTVGELDHAILLRQYVGQQQANELSPLWRGGQYRLLTDKTGDHVVLLYAVQWENPAIARRYFSLYQSVLKAKWKNMRIDSESENTVSGEGDDGKFLLTVEGACVKSIEGMPTRNVVHHTLR